MAHTIYIIERSFFQRILRMNRNTVVVRFSTFFNYSDFRQVLEQATNITVLTGSGVSAESGIGTFRGSAGIWRTHNSTDLATPEAFKANPSLVWEFYEWRRMVAFKAEPNNAHLALAKFEKKCTEEKKIFTLLTQNVDGLHLKAGSQNVFEMHGSLRKVMCTKCKIVEENINIPICEALRDTGDPKETATSNIPLADLPTCKHCNGLLRPFIVWFGENLDDYILLKCREALETCHLFLVIGTSLIVYPAAGFVSFVEDRNVPVAEFNINPVSSSKFTFEGPCGRILPEALGIEITN